jgi:hypothetical protein
MKKIRLIGIIGTIVILLTVLILKLISRSGEFLIPFLLPFLVMILIDLSGKNKTK